MKTYPCRCPGKAPDEKPNTEDDVRGWEPDGVQDDGEGGALSQHTCPNCGCSFWIEHKDERPPATPPPPKKARAPRLPFRDSAREYDARNWRDSMYEAWDRR